MKYMFHLKWLHTGFMNLPVTKIHNQLHKKPFSLTIRTYATSTKQKNLENVEEQKNEPATEKIKKRKTKTTKSLPNNTLTLENDMNFQDIKDQLPAKLLKRRRSLPDSLYLINKDTAHDILFAILPYLQMPTTAKSNLIEINPGLGFLTDLLLNNWTREITVFEQTKHFSTTLNALSESHRDRINIKYSNFYDIWRFAYQDKHDNGNRVSSMFGEIPQIPWGRDFCSTIIGSAPLLSFVKHLINSLVFQHSIMSMGRHQMFFAMTPSQYLTFTCTREAGYRQYRSYTMMFQIFFEFKLLCKLPRSSFLPLEVEPKQTNTLTSKLRHIDSEFLYLTRIVPRANLYNLCRSEDMKQLWYFIRHNCLSRKNRVIPHLERWIPNCGPRLITSPAPKKTSHVVNTMKAGDFDITLESPPISDRDYYPNMTIFTEFGDLTPSQMLTLFRQFKNWPEFAESTFVASMENLLLKMENADEIDDVEDDDAHEEQQDVDKINHKEK